MSKEFDPKTHSLREVMEYSRGIAMSDGGLAMLIEKIVEEVEKLQEEVISMKDVGEWIDWEKFTPPNDVKVIFIKYADGSVFPDHYNSDGSRRHKRDKPIAWKFMERTIFEKATQPIMR